ncbi:MAG: WHG domain-containing protein [Bacteroides sp.]|nr:WHG domain-containing protein [Eubacterium sp.]MCM1419362.1 WHG domain-containing protein [Roseburia sp.]MCM1463012.1 WHG domain-containing protein [Bacteroides sp.]
MPKAKITREMVVDAAFAVARESGAENVNARTVAKRLSCSTQPVMYHFERIEELKRAVYEKADRFHTEYLMTLDDPGRGILLGIGLNYIRFAIREPYLFRLLFQSGYAVGNSLPEAVESEALSPLLAMMGEAMGTNPAGTKEVFMTLALLAHGYASLVANRALPYDEASVAEELERVYRGAILALKEERQNV